MTSTQTVSRKRQRPEDSRGSADPNAPAVLIYALGGGLGHVTRGLALARKLLPLVGGEGVLVTNALFADAIRHEVARVSELTLQAIAAEAKKGDVSREIADVFRAREFDVVVVDTFPRGLAGELAELLPSLSERTLKVLLGRNLPAGYVQEFDLFSFARRHYHQVLVPGEKSVWEHLPDCVSVPPILIREQDEILPARDAAKLLRLAPDQKCVLIVGSGTSAEVRELLELMTTLAADWSADRPPLRVILPPQVAVPTAIAELAVQHYPALELLSAVRVVIGGAGYHLVHEAELAGVPLLCLARPRLYDDQVRRSKESPVAMCCQSIQDIRARLREVKLYPIDAARPPGGAAQAATFIHHAYRQLHSV